MCSCARRYNADAAENWRINTGLPGNIVVSHLASNRIRDTPSLMTESHLARSSPRSPLSPSRSLRLSGSPRGDRARPSENLRRSAHARQIIPPYARFLRSEL